MMIILAFLGALDWFRVPTSELSLPAQVVVYALPTIPAAAVVHWLGYKKAPVSTQLFVSMSFFWGIGYFALLFGVYL